LDATFTQSEVIVRLLGVHALEAWAIVSKHESQAYFIHSFRSLMKRLIPFDTRSWLYNSHHFHEFPT